MTNTVPLLDNEYVSRSHEHASGYCGAGYVVVPVELPGDGLVVRVTNAVDAAFKPTTAEGRRGQRRLLHNAMVAKFGKRAPSYMTVTRWLKAPKRLTIDAAYLIALASGVDPMHLAFGDLLKQRPKAPVNARVVKKVVVRRPPPQEDAAEDHPLTEKDARRSKPHDKAG
jgi:hypothetical protein